MATTDATALEKVFNLLEEPTALLLGIPEPLFTAILEAIASPFVQGLADSRRLLAPFSAPDWRDLSAADQERFIQVAEKAYPKFTDWMSCFQITELLGDHGDGKRALAVLSRLRRSSPDVARSLVPNGLDGLARNPRDPEVAVGALGELLAMKGDTSRAVREEVLQSLGRIIGRIKSSGKHPLASRLKELLAVQQSLAQALQSRGPAT